MSNVIRTSPVKKLRSRIMADGYRYVALNEQHDGEDRFDNNSGWRQKKSSRLYCILLSILVVVVIIMTSFIIWQQAVHSKSCLTPQCVENSGSIISKMNLSVDPCVDFYEYACGRWIDEAVIKPEASSHTMFSDAGDNNKQIILQLISEENNDKSTAIMKAKLYYKNCLDTEKINELGTSTILQLIKDLGSWTVTSDDVSGIWNRDSWDLTVAVATTASYGISSLMSLSVGLDDKDISVNIIEVSQGGLTLSSRDEYLKNATKYKEGFLKFAIQYGRLLGANDSVTDKMQSIYDFEKSLAEIFIPKEELIDREKTYNKLTVEDLNNMLNNQIDIPRYLRLSTQETILSNTKILVKTPEYFRKLGLLLAKTDKEILANYVLWSMIQYMTGYLPNQFITAALQLSKVEAGVKDLPARWNRCVSKVNMQLGFATSSLYLHKRFSKENRAEVVGILEDVKQALIDDIEVITWMDKETASKAIEKVYSIRNMIGFPDWVLELDKLDEYYENLTIVKDQFFINHLETLKFLHLKYVGELHKKTDPNKWGMFPHQVNAYYSPNRNQIVFPAGILQPPFYNSLMPFAVKYGALGMVIGHELTHGFDNLGRKFDKQGNMKNWWSEKSVKKFKEKSKCMENQYSQYSIHGMNLNGKFTLSENIADNGGIKMAYSAFKSSGKSTNLMLPGLDLSEEQLVFLGYAQVWCAKYRLQNEKISILTDVHSIKKFRIIGSLSNSPEFSSAFNCPSDSPMNPKKKCTVW